MIVSASYRTDIPAFYAPWFTARLAAGWCEVANPYGAKPYRVDLSPAAVDGLVLWTRNMAPLIGELGAIAARYPLVVQFTATGYPRALETSVISSERALEQMRAIASLLGPRALVWRYDPILFSDLTPPDWHRRQFRHLATALDGVVDEVVVSFARMYRKTARNLALAGAAHGFAWRDPEDREKRALLGEFSAVAADSGMRLALCTQPNLHVPGAIEARCIDACRLSDVAGRPIGGREKGNREGCRCAESRDIGGYHTCPHGCAYCYAVGSQKRAREAFRRHTPCMPSLVTAGGREKPTRATSNSR